jgi:preprotein translocase subunit SecD
MNIKIAAMIMIGFVLGVVCKPAGAVGQNEGQTGFYLVSAEGLAIDSLPAPMTTQWIARYDYKFIQPEEREPTRYLLLSKQPDVVSLLSKPPEKLKGENGRTQLLLELTEEAAADLARVSRDHIGQRVAFVIDGEVISIHKIRSVITDGKFRMSRCTDNACEYIYGRLTKR